MKKIFTIVFILTSFTMYAQLESTSIGLRGGGVSGMTIKLVDHDLSAVEIIVGYQRQGMKMVGLIEKYRPIKTDRIANLFVVTGLGAHAGYVKYDEHNTKNVDGTTYYSYQTVYSPIIGGDMLIGLEYHFESVPINISLDYKPYMEFFGEKIFRFDFWDIGFSLRYVLNHKNL